VRRFILFHGKRHPRDLGPKEVEAFLTHLAVRGRVSGSTQNQAKSAILFLFRKLSTVSCRGSMRLWLRGRRSGYRWCCRSPRSRRCWSA
jgi:hypothetical protein